MARQKRVLGSGLLYHVIARGNRRETVFPTPGDYETYLHRLAVYRVRYAVTLHAYCLMPNHVHLVLRTADGSLARFMQSLQQSYTQRFNHRHGQVGHVFQGRYKAFVCATEEYLLTLVRYVHLNPVRAGLVTRPGDYPYSGHRAYLEGAPTGLVDSTLVLSLVGGASGYVRLLANELEGEAPSAPAQVRAWLPSVEPAEPRSPGRPDPREPLERALTCLPRELRVDVEALRRPDRSRPAHRARALAAYVLVRRLGYRLTDVATSLRRDGSTTSILVQRLGQRLPSDPATAQEIEGLLRPAEVKVKA
jgi:putative transposase